MVRTCLVYRNVLPSILPTLWISTCKPRSFHSPSSSHSQCSESGRVRNALMWNCLIYNLHVSWLLRASAWGCELSVQECTYVYTCANVVPLQHVAWWVRGDRLVRRGAAVWRSGLLFQRKAYVALTVQAVQGSHQNKLFIRSNGNCSHEGAGCIQSH